MVKQSAKNTLPIFVLFCIVYRYFYRYFYQYGWRSKLEGPETLFNLPLSSLAASQLIELARDLNSLPNDWGERLLVLYIWSSSFFSTSKAYTYLTCLMPTHPFFLWLWKSSCQNKHKTFFRLLMRRRNTQLPSYHCVYQCVCSAVIWVWRKKSHTCSSLVILHKLIGLRLILWWWSLIQF